MSTGLTYTSTCAVPSPRSIFSIPDTGNFIWLLHDYQTIQWDYKPRSIKLNYKKDPPSNALPETIPMWGCKPDDFIPLSREWQYFWYELLRTSVHNTYSEQQLRKAWASITADHRALTDRHAVQNGFADYVLGLNLNSDPISIKCLSMGGNIAEVIKTTSKYYYIKTLDPTQSPPSILDIWGDFSLIHWATEETTLKLPGQNNWQVSRWPQLRPYGVPFPLLGIGGTNKILKDRAVVIPAGSFYSPYNYS